MNHQQVAHHLALYRTNPSLDENTQERVVRASRTRRSGRPANIGPRQPRRTRGGALTVQAPTHQRTQTFRQQGRAVSQAQVCSAQNARIHRLKQIVANFHTEVAHKQARLDMFERKAHEAALKIAQARTDLWSQQANIMEAAAVIARAGITIPQLRQLSNIRNAASSLTQIIQN